MTAIWALALHGGAGAIAERAYKQEEAHMAALLDEGAAMLTRGVAQTMQSRGLPRPITEAEWTRAGETVPLSQITWAQTPTADDMRFFYPVRQWRAQQGGQARLQCLVVEAGALRCRAEGQSAFNDAALRLATRLRAPENDAAGQPLRNRRVVVPIRFQPAS